MAGVLRTRRRRIVAASAAAVVAVAAAFVVVTAFTGLPGPGVLRRYEASQLEAMVDAVHEQAGPLRTPDDCWQTLDPDFTEVDTRAIASVDWVRSRVVVSMRADNVGNVDPRTRAAVEDRLQTVVEEHPELTLDMVELEASPEGWSPLMSCALVVRGFGTF
jgi:hypothetical protein